MAAARTGEKTEPADLLAQVTAARELFRSERENHESQQAKEWAALVEEKAELDRRAIRIERLKRQAEADREKARRVYQRYLKRMRTRWIAERKSAASERAELARNRARLTAEQERFEFELQRRTTQLNEYKTRLTSAWELLSENQRRLLADRQQAEAWLAERTATIERQQRLIQDRANRETDTVGRLDARVGSLLTEIAGLEARAANTRGILRQLEMQRAEAEAKGSSSAPGSAIERLTISLETERFHPAISQEADRLLTELNESSQAANRERIKLTAVREQLDREADDLADQRAVLTEQVAALAAARDLWHSNEHTTVVELESLARAVRGKEQEIEERERGQLEAERQRRSREYDLWQLRTKLEGWQAALAAHESAAFADRDRVENELSDRHEQLTRWEASLAKVQKAWTFLREKEKDHLNDELAHWAEARHHVLVTTTHAEKTRTQLLSDLAELATNKMVAEESSLAEPRRLRVLKKRWESHFNKLKKELEFQAKTAKADLTRAEERWQELQVKSRQFLEEQIAERERQQRIERERIANERENSEPAAVTISIEEARRKRGEVALIELRSEIERLSALLLHPPLEPGVVQLVKRAA
jgi:hypothetical protein